MGLTDGSGNEPYRGVSADIDTLGEWATELGRWEPVAERNGDLSDCASNGGGGLPSVAKASVAHAKAASAALSIVGGLDRLWSGTRQAIATAATGYADTDAAHAAALERLRKQLDTLAKGG